MKFSRICAATSSSSLLALFLLIGLTGCTKKDTDGNQQVLHRMYLDAMKTWDPANAYDEFSDDAVYNVYEPLFQYDYLREGYKIVPLIAADFPKVSADRLTVTIPIRHGIHYADDPCFKATNGKGRELKAQDFVLGIKRLAHPDLDSQGYWIFDGKMAGYSDFHDKMVKATSKEERAKIFNQEIEGIKALDDYTLQIKLLKPYPQLLYTLAMTFTAPVAHEQLETYADEKGNLTDHPVGTGPFILKLWDRERKIELVRNPNYHPEFYPTQADPIYKEKGLLADAGKPLPFLDKIVISIIKEEQPTWLEFINQNQDIVRIQKDHFNQAMLNNKEVRPEFKEKGIWVDIQTGVTTYYFYFNMKDKLLGSNKYLRQAISSSVDRQKWIEIFKNGAAEKQVTALPPGIPDRPANPKLKYDFDLAKAKELMKKAGYPNGEGLPVINFDMRAADSVTRQLGEFLTQQFGQIGVKVNMIYNTFSAFLEKEKMGNTQMAFGGWGLDYPDAENEYQILYGKNVAPGPNGSNYANPEFDKIYEQMLTMEPGPARAVLVQKLDDITQEDCTWALGYYNTRYELQQPWVKNLRGSDLMLGLYKYWKIDLDLKKKLKK